MGVTRRAVSLGVVVLTGCGALPYWASFTPEDEFALWDPLTARQLEIEAEAELQYQELHGDDDEDVVAEPLIAQRVRRAFRRYEMACNPATLRRRAEARARAKRRRSGRCSLSTGETVAGAAVAAASILGAPRGGQRGGGSPRRNCRGAPPVHLGPPPVPPPGPASEWTLAQIEELERVIEERVEECRRVGR